MKGLCVFVLGLWAACYNPDLSKVMYTCTQAQPQCPQGHSCYEGRCVSRGSEPPADLGADQATQPPADLAPLHGCASGRGAQVGASAWACPGAFTPGHVQAQCAAGFSLCTDAAGIELKTCETVTGFFIANVRGSDNTLDCDPYPVRCKYDNGDERPLWFGCGSVQRIVQRCKAGCSGFAQVLNGTLAYNETPRRFTDSFTKDIEAQRNTEPTFGVLCCAN